MDAYRGSGVLTLLIASACSGQPSSRAADTGGASVDGGSDASTDAVSHDGSVLDSSAEDAAGMDAGFVVAPHPALPKVIDNGGPKLNAPAIVTITYANDPHRATLEAHATWALGSSWFSTVGREYGIQGGSILRHVQLTHDAPPSIDDSDIAGMLTAKIADHSLPEAPQGGFDNMLYVIYFPATTSVSAQAMGSPTNVCQGYGAFHTETATSGPHFAYAVIPACPSQWSTMNDLEFEEFSASHEIVEAATDPFIITNPGWTVDASPSNPWGAVAPEVGDLCDFTGSPDYREGAWVAQRIYSNRAAAAQDRDPCIPSVPAPYFNVASTPTVAQTLAAGSTVSFDLAAWSLAPVAPWKLVAMSSGDFMPSIRLSTTSIDNGGVGRIDVGVPRSATSGNQVVVTVFSVRTSTSYQAWPLLIDVR
jgi:hypothetical protein